MAGEPIDRTTIKIEADASSVPAEVEKAKTAVGGGLVDALKKSRQAAFGLVTSLGAIVGTVVGMYRLGAVIRDEIDYRLKSGTDRAKDFTEALDLSKGEESVASLSRQLENLNAKIAGSKESILTNGVNTFFGDTVAKMQEEASEILRVLTSTQAAVNAKEQRAREKKAAEEKAEREKKIQAEVDAADEAVRASIAKTLEGEEKIIAERNANIMRLRESQSKAQTEYAKSAYDTAIDFERRAADGAIAEYRRGLEEKKAESERAAQEELARTQKLAREQARAFEQAFKQIRADAANAFPTDQIAAQMGRLADVVEAIEQRVQAGFQ